MSNLVIAARRIDLQTSTVAELPAASVSAQFSEMPLNARNRDPLPGGRMPKRQVPLAR